MLVQERFRALSGRARAGQSEGEGGINDTKKIDNNGRRGMYTLVAAHAQYIFQERMMMVRRMGMKPLR